MLSKALHKLRDDWKGDKGAILDEIRLQQDVADATRREIHDHFEKLHMTLKGREIALIRSVNDTHAKCCEPLKEHVDIIDSLNVESKRLIRLAKTTLSTAPVRYRLFPICSFYFLFGFLFSLGVKGGV